MIYWMDTDAFVQSKNGPYQLERVPQFWAFLSQQIEAGRIKSPKKVYDEVMTCQDDLSLWVKSRATGLCTNSNKQIQKCYGDILSYLLTERSQNQVYEFARGADGWVIAHAFVGDDAVVSHESERRKNAKIKIPWVCKQFNVKCINVYKMLEELDFRAQII